MCNVGIITYAIRYGNVDRDKRNDKCVVKYLLHTMSISKAEKPI